MALALSLHFDHATADAVRIVWDALAIAGESRDMLDLGYPPHLTLIVADDEGLAPVLYHALPALAPLVPGRLVLGDIRRFEGTSVVWASYGADLGELTRLHTAAAGLLALEAIDPHYRPGSWMPHVTMAVTGVPENLMRVAREAWRPRHDVRTTRLEVARFPPAEALEGIELPAA